MSVYTRLCFVKEMGEQCARPMRACVLVCVCVFVCASSVRVHLEEERAVHILSQLMPHTARVYSTQGTRFWLPTM